MFKTSLFVALAILLSLTCAQLPDAMLTPTAVIETLYGYATALNHLGEYAVGPSCNFATIDTASANAVGSALVQEFYSANVRQFLVTQQTANLPTAVVVNFTNGVPFPYYFGNNTNLFQNLQTFYPLFTTFDSSPFYWVLSMPIVDSIKLRDTAYGNAITAYVRATDVNTGFHCTGNNGTRVFTTQQSVYNLVLTLENQGTSSAAWRIINFEETGKNQYGFPTLPTQQQPAP